MAAKAPKDRRLIQTLGLKNILSFGESSQPIELRQLNVLIGANGSGKSNIIECLGLLHNLPKNLSHAVSLGGGVAEWLWKGASKLPVNAQLDATISPLKGAVPIRYSIRFGRAEYQVEVVDEVIESAQPLNGQKIPHTYYSHSKGRAYINTNGKSRELKRDEEDPGMSVLSQRKAPETYPELTYVGRAFDDIRIYRDWEFGSLSNVRDMCAADLPGHQLEEDASNLGMVLSRLLSEIEVKRDLLRCLKLFYEDAVDLQAVPKQGLVDVILEERSLKSAIPLKRLSDGTIRWLMLLAILLNPTPPRLVCIEEPELGLHPDMVHELGKLLIAASERMQLVVTTHSEILLESFTECPEAVLVCEKRSGQTQVARLDRGSLSAWLKDYSLGQLWRKGEIGGNRW